jgi:hypothetical protein
VTFTTLRDVRADELQQYDWPVSLAGYRPIERIKELPRKRMVHVWVDGTKYALYRDHIIGRVRRPVMASLQHIRTFDPNDSQVR